MAVILQMTYMKKLGLPNFSSHSCAVSLTVEIPDASVVAQKAGELYQLLQTAVDGEIQHVGWMPNAETSNCCKQRWTERSNTSAGCRMPRRMG
jgi:phosphoenolpyruvate-protein kinase (PTS system EI component)